MLMMQILLWRACSSRVGGSSLRIARDAIAPAAAGRRRTATAERRTRRPTDASIAIRTGTRPARGQGLLVPARRGRDRRARSSVVAERRATTARKAIRMPAIEPPAIRPLDSSTAGLVSDSSAVVSLEPIDQRRGPGRRRRSASRSRAAGTRPPRTPATRRRPVAARPRATRPEQHQRPGQLAGEDAVDDHGEQRGLAAALNLVDLGAVVARLDDAVDRPGRPGSGPCPSSSTRYLPGSAPCRIALDDAARRGTSCRPGRGSVSVRSLDVGAVDAWAGIAGRP